MHPRHKALRHPAAEELLQYASTGCPLDCGQDWTISQMEAAILKGSHTSAESPDARYVLHTEALECIAEGCCCIVK